MKNLISSDTSNFRFVLSFRLIYRLSVIVVYMEKSSCNFQNFDSLSESLNDIKLATSISLALIIVSVLLSKCA